MIDCCKWLGTAARRGNEDVLFSKCMIALRYRVPTCQEAMTFAVEAYHDNKTVPLGVHDTALRLPPDDSLKTHCPEAIFLQ